MSVCMLLFCFCLLICEIIHWERHYLDNFQKHHFYEEITLKNGHLSLGNINFLRQESIIKIVVSWVGAN